MNEEIKCAGKNCNALNGVGHSDECIKEHEACISCVKVEMPNKTITLGSGWKVPEGYSRVAEWRIPKSGDVYLSCTDCFEIAEEDLSISVRLCLIREEEKSCASCGNLMQTKKNKLSKIGILAIIICVSFSSFVIYGILTDCKNTQNYQHCYR